MTRALLSHIARAAKSSMYYCEYNSVIGQLDNRPNTSKGLQLPSTTIRLTFLLFNMIAKKFMIIRYNMTIIIK